MPEKRIRRNPVLPPDGGVPASEPGGGSIFPSPVSANLILDWRAFDPQEYLSHPAIHNTGTVLVQRGDNRTDMHDFNYQWMPAGALSPHPERGAVVLNLHQSVSRVEMIEETVDVPYETTRPSRFLKRPEKTTEIRTQVRRREVPFAPLTAGEIFQDIDSPEQVFAEEMRVALPTAFLREIDAADLPYDPEIGRTAAMTAYTTETNDRWLSQLAPSVQAIVMKHLMLTLLAEGQHEQGKLEEFSQWLEQIPTFAYDFDQQTRVPLR